MARTFITLMAGAFVGILLSPISLWLLLHGDQISPVQVEKGYLSCARATVTQRDVSASSSGKVTSRKLVYTAVLASQDGVRTRAGPIHRTWGKQLGKHFGLYIFSKPGLPVSTHVDGVPVIFVPTNTSASIPQNLQKLLLLQHLMETTPSLLDYEFVLLTGDDLFVHSANLHRLLQSVSPKNAFYLGRAASSNHCLGGPGILLSQAALIDLKKKIGNCVKSLSNQVYSYDIDGDEILGKCMQSSLGLHCSELDKEQSHRFYQHGRGEFGSSGTLQILRDVVENAVTIHPVIDPVTFYHIHQLTMEHNYKIKMDQASSAVSSAERVSDHLQRSANVFGKQWWLWYSKAHANPKTRYELNTWQYFNSSDLCLSQEHQPMVSLPSRLKNAISTAIDIIAKRVNTSDNRAVLPYTLVDGFMLVDEAWGFEYVLRMSSVNSRKHHIAHVYFPLQGPGMTILRPVQNSLETVVNLIVPVPRRHTLANFLEFFETDYIKENEHVHLHLVFFEHDEPMTVKIRQIQHIYPNARIVCHEIKGHAYSTSHAYNYVSTKLAKNALMVFFDLSFYFTPEFLQHCRMNAIQGKQAYSPVLFAFYKPDLVTKYAPQKQQTIITTNTGFFLRYNYQVLALYNSDFVSLGRLTKLKGSGTDDVRFVDKLLLSNVYLMRGLEPYLRKNYKPRSCKGLKTSTRSACMNSMADSIGSKKVLGSLAASQNIF